jgi:hypothetical protein
MVVVYLLWTCFGIATRPRSDIYSIDWSAVLVIVDHRVAGQETPHRFLLDPSFTQGGIEASPSAAMNGSEAEVRRRRDVTLTRSQDCVGQLEECIGAPIED